MWTFHRECCGFFRHYNTTAKMPTFVLTDIGDQVICLQSQASHEKIGVWTQRKSVRCRQHKLETDLFSSHTATSLEDISTSFCLHTSTETVCADAFLLFWLPGSAGFCHRFLFQVRSKLWVYQKYWSFPSISSNEWKSLSLVGYFPLIILTFFHH